MNMNKIQYSTDEALTIEWKMIERILNGIVKL
jgi:hypothetical protein